MSQQKGVCFLFDDFHPVFSGHSIYMQQIMKRLQNRGRRVTVICWNQEGLMASEVYRDIHIVRLPPPTSDLGRTRIVLAALWRLRGDFDCLHINGFPDPYGLWIAFCRLFGKRIVLQSTLFGSDDGYAYVRNHRGGKLRVWQLSWVDAITAISRPLIETFAEIGISPEKLVYLPQGVDLKRFVPVSAQQKMELRRQRDLPADSPVVLFVGTILLRKGVDWLMEAWIEVQKSIPEAHLILVGMHTFDQSHDNGVELNRFADAMKAQAEDDGMKVKFVGLQDEIAAWYQVADILVLPSRKEGFGNVIIEAMACRLPVIVTPMDGVALETVLEGHNGFIVDDVEKLAARLRDLLADPSRAEEYGLAGEKRAHENFDLEKISSKYDQLYFGS